MVISRTPFRISFFGGGTDYPEWYERHGGSVIATTINKYCYLTCRYLPPFFEHRFRVVYSKIEDRQHVDDIAHPSVREVIRYLQIDRGLEIHHDGDLPARSGMGSSSAFTVGLLHALYALQGCMPDKHRLAQESIHIEQKVLQETVGSQDQVSAAYGGFNHITFFPNGEIVVHPIILSRERIREINAHLMLFYTGIKRTASNIASSYVNDLEQKKRPMRIMKALVKESLSVLNCGRDLAEFGELLDESWQLKRSLSDKITTPYMDEMYNAARAAGAIGGKITGAGGGGFMLLFVPPEKQTTVREALRSLLHIPFTFEFSGSQIVFFDPEEDYAALDKERSLRSIAGFQENDNTE